MRTGRDPYVVLGVSSGATACDCTSVVDKADSGPVGYAGGLAGALAWGGLPGSPGVVGCVAQPASASSADSPRVYSNFI